MQPLKRPLLITEGCFSLYQPTVKKARYESQKIILPNDIWSQVFKNYLPVIELANIKSVSTVFYELANVFWKEGWKNECQKSYPLVDHLYECVNINWFQCIRSLNSLKEKVEKINLDQLKKDMNLKVKFSGKGEMLCIISNYVQVFERVLSEKKEEELEKVSEIKVVPWDPKKRKIAKDNCNDMVFVLTCLKLAVMQQNPEAVEALVNYEALKKLSSKTPIWEYGKIGW